MEFFNPVITSVILLCCLCLLRVNVLFSLMLSAIVAGFLAKMPIEKIMELFNYRLYRFEVSETVNLVR